MGPLDDAEAMQRSGSNEFVAWHLAQGDTRGETLAALDRRFSEYTGRAQRCAFEAGLRAWQAASAINELGRIQPNTPPPTSGGAPQGYVSTVIVTLDGVPGVPGGRAQRQFDLRTPGVPTRIGLLDDAGRLITEIAFEQPARPGYEGWERVSVHDIEVLSVERGRA